MTPPKFITFTGADEHTDVARMLALSSQYPIEWGILFSPKRQGSGRYPPLQTAMKFQAYAPALKLSAHLCGDYSADVIRCGGLPIYRQAFSLQSFILKCQRVQINSGLADLNVGQVSAWAKNMGTRVIFQTRTAFPDDPRADWLFDASGGRGIQPSYWPVPGQTGEQVARLKGYAGGIGPDNVKELADMIGGGHGDGVELSITPDPNFYLDMESRVRDEYDRFDLDKCEAVCRAVYGDRPT